MAEISRYDLFVLVGAMAQFEKPKRRPFDEPITKDTQGAKVGKLRVVFTPTTPSNIVEHRFNLRQGGLLIVERNCENDEVVSIVIDGPATPLMLPHK